MAVLSILKVNENLAYIISDEEYITQRGNRRSYHSNNIHSILNRDMENKLNMAFIVGFVGFSDFGMEFTLRLKSMISDLAVQDSGPFPKDIIELSYHAGRVLSEMTKQKINRRLEYLYGFNTDDINRTYFEDKDVRIEIKQTEIINKALEIINKRESSSVIREINGIEFVFAGYDRDGIKIFTLGPQNFILSPVNSMFTSIGAGSDVSNLVFAEFAGNVPLKRRREGIDPYEGLLEIFRSINQSSMHNHQVGGYCHLCIIDKNSDSPVRTFSDHRPKTGSDIVKSFMGGWITKETALGLLKGLFFENVTDEDAEKELFRKTHDKKGLDLFLRGYKYMEEFHKVKRHTDQGPCRAGEDK